jgi:hypothetical protein
MDEEVWIKRSIVESILKKITCFPGNCLTAELSKNLFNFANAPFSKGFLSPDSHALIVVASTSRIFPSRL